MLFERFYFVVDCRDFVVCRVSFEKLVYDSEIWREAQFWHLSRLGWQRDACFDDGLDEAT